jgi:hypothetical protein
METIVKKIQNSIYKDHVKKIVGTIHYLNNEFVEVDKNDMNICQVCNKTLSNNTCIEICQDNETIILCEQCLIKDYSFLQATKFKESVSLQTDNYNACASLIQSVWRGRQVISKKYKDNQIFTLVEYNEHEIASATLIQSVWRGRHGRRMLHKLRTYFPGEGEEVIYSPLFKCKRCYNIQLFNQCKTCGKVNYCERCYRKGIYNCPSDKTCIECRHNFIEKYNSDFIIKHIINIQRVWRGFSTRQKINFVPSEILPTCDEILDILKMNHKTRLLNSISINNLLVHEYYNNIEFTNFLCELININNNINYSFDNSGCIDFNNNKFESLDSKGVLIFKNILSEENINLLLNEINNKKMYNPKQNIYDSIDIFKNYNDIWWQNNPNQIFKLDSIQNLITDSNLLNLMQKYLRTTPILYACNFWVTYPGKRDVTQYYHQDFDDIKFLKLFIYLNDVNDQNGPHFYIQNSLNKIIKDEILPEGFRVSCRVFDKFFDKFNEDQLQIEGDKGTLILEDTKGFHKGSNVKSGKRYILQFLFGVSNVFKMKYPDYDGIKLDKETSPILYEAKQKYPYIYQNVTF